GGRADGAPAQRHAARHPDAAAGGLAAGGPGGLARGRRAFGASDPAILPSAQDPHAGPARGNLAESPQRTQRTQRIGNGAETTRDSRSKACAIPRPLVISLCSLCSLWL